MIKITYYCDICKKDEETLKKDECHIIGYALFSNGVIARKGLVETERHICSNCLNGFRELQ